MARTVTDWGSAKSSYSKGSFDGMAKCFPERWALELTVITFSSQSNHDADRGGLSASKLPRSFTDEKKTCDQRREVDDKCNQF